MTVLILIFSWVDDISVAKSSLILILAPGLHILSCCRKALAGPYYRIHFDMENRELVINRSDGLRQVIPFDDLVIRRVDGGDEGVASYFIFLTTKTTQPGDVNIVYPCSPVLASDARSPVEASIISMDIFSMMLLNTEITGENTIKE